MKSNLKQACILVCSCILLGCAHSGKTNDSDKTDNPGKTDYSVKTDKEIDPDAFLLTGQINGYKPRTEPLIGEIYYNELFTGKDLVKVAEVTYDGHFQVPILLKESQEMKLNFGSYYYTIYGTPKGKLNLALYMDYPDSCEYSGDGADISKELAFYNQFRTANYSKDYENMRSDMEVLSPNDFKAKRERILAKRLHTIDSLQTARHISPEIADLIRDKEQLHHGDLLLDFSDARKYLSKENPDNPVAKQPTPSNFYTFLTDMPFEKKEAVSLRQYGEILRGIRYSHLIMDAQNSVKDTIITLKYTLLTYLLDKNVPLTDEERKIAEGHREFIGVHKVNPVFLKAFNEKLNVSVYRPFEEKYKAWVDSFNVKVQKDVDAGNHPLNYNISSIRNDLESLTKRWEACNKAFKEIYPQTPSLAFDIFALQYFIEQLKGVASPADADTLFNERTHFITNNTIKEIMKEKYQKRFSSSNQLPETIGGNIVRSLIAPHKGKYVLLDFWGTTCGPCRADIDQFSELRKSYTGSPDFAYVFITSPLNSPDKDYEKYISNQLNGEESHFLPKHEYAYLQELFAMNGIPRYVLIDREGNLIDDYYDIYGLEEFLKKENIRKGTTMAIGSIFK